MASARQRRATEDDAVTGPRGDAPVAIRIDTDVLAALTEPAGDGSDAESRIEQWLDCWRP